MSWRISKSLENLRDSINELYPERFKGTDGAISGYAGSKSSHNVNSLGVVNAYDFSVGDYPNGITHHEAVELTNKIKDKLHLIGGESNVIYNRQIADGYSQVWRPYNGPDPHTNHFHIATEKDYYMGANPSGLTDYDLNIDWELNDMALSDSDVERIAKAVLDTRTDKIGTDVNGKSGGTTSLREVIAYDNSNRGWLVNEVRNVFIKAIRRRGGKRQGALTTFEEQLQWADANQETIENKLNQIIAKDSK